MGKLNIGIKNHKFKTKDGMLSHRDAYSKYVFNVRLADVDTVNIEGAGFGKCWLKIVGQGTTLASVKMPVHWAKKAQKFIWNEIDIYKNEQDDNKQEKTSLDDLEKLAALQEKGVITEEEFEAKKKKILDL